ncbi:MAG: Trifunctional nucleotide phosphoesterase protein YfkN precursor [Candidatus Omnitrophica bacterium ADurb.Bin205]|nr:MAG: Trifunctional nucleotide phosphoesterase protein YfkN precursor [Candidatus Omnitrophica bacterium ADurb.Bin205]
MSKKIPILLLAVISIFLVGEAAFAQEITLLYTGQTHAMLYPCDCPVEADGGVARRAALIKQLRKSNPNTLLLDSGNYFAGGLLDQVTQNTQLDMQRTVVNLRAMELMQYDALNLSNDEFNFGERFFEDSAAKLKLNFVSSNIQSERISYYIIKEIAGIKIGIVGLANHKAKEKLSVLSFSEPLAALKDSVAKLKERGVDIVILLSNIGSEECQRLVKEVPGIDLVLEGGGSFKEDISYKKGETIFLRPVWQARKLGKAVLKIKNKKIVDSKTEEIRVSDKITDDPQVLSILPRCFSDNNCKKDGLVGSCLDAGSDSSRCIFSEAAKVRLTVVTSKDCAVCNTEVAVNSLRQKLPGLEVASLYHPEKNALALVEKLGISGLPAYVLDKGIEKAQAFDSLRDSLNKIGDYYVLKPEVAGVAYLLDRERFKGRLDVFISLYDKDSFEVLGLVGDFNPKIHFLAIALDDGFDAPKGMMEVEEILRCVCVNKYYPELFFDYISCRAKNINSSWWEDCAKGLDTDKIRECARQGEGGSLLRENIQLSKELKIMFGPVYLLDNKEIFGSKGVPKKEDFKKIIKR